MKTVEGKVEAVSIKNRGIKVNGIWYNVDETFLDILKNIRRGSYVKLEVDDFNNVLNIEVGESPSFLSIGDKIELLRLSTEIYKLHMTFNIPKVEFETAEGKDVKVTLEEIRKIYEKLKQWILS